jgi:glucuronokinase
VKTISKKAFARAGLLGNPSDGYNGKTISLIVRNFFAEVTLHSSEHLKIIPADDDTDRFRSIGQFRRQMRQRGYYGGVRLLKASINRLADYCQTVGHSLHDENFSITYTSNIPRQVGLAGSSAIVTAAMRGLMAWFQIDIPPHLLASLVLSAETALGIPAGLQDRVIQAFEGLVYMNFEPSKMRHANGLAYGQYEPLDPSKLPSLYLAFAKNAGEPTEVVHDRLRERFNRGDREVVEAMKSFASLAQQGRAALLNGDHGKLSALIDQNFNLRQSICKIHRDHQQMVDCARNLGASAKFCGSGGAIIGTLSGASLHELSSAMAAIDCDVIVPEITPKF